MSSVPPSPAAAAAAALDAGWRRADLLSAAASVPGLELQQPSEQRPHKVSLRLRQPGAGAAADTTLGALRAALAATGAPHALIYSSSRDVDILPAGASKGAALGALLRQLAARHGVAPADVAARTMAAGDSGNDEALLGGVDGVAACVVGNAQPELAAWAASEAAAAGRRVYRARGRAAAGVLEALQHFGWMPAD